MKIIWYLFSLTLLILTGCSTNSDVDIQDEDIVHDKQIVIEEQSIEEISAVTEEQNNKYNIETLIISSETEVKNSNYNKLHFYTKRILEEIAQDNNIKIEELDLKSYTDEYIALERGDIDLITGIVEEDNEELVQTYSYYTGPVVGNDGHELLSERSFTFLVRKSDQDLLNLLNDMILEYNKAGKLQEFENEIMK